MALRKDIKASFEKYHNCKVNSVKLRYGYETTMNQRFHIYKIEVWVKNPKYKLNKKTNRYEKISN